MARAPRTPRRIRLTAGIVVLAFFTVMDERKMAVAARRNAVVRRKQCEVKIAWRRKTGGDDDNVGVESGNGLAEIVDHWMQVIALKLRKGAVGLRPVLNFENMAGCSRLDDIMSTLDNSVCVKPSSICIEYSWLGQDPCYATFHDEEWGVQVHDDEKLFELLCLSGALSELTWPVILNRRHIFRDVFLDFNPIAVSKLNDKKIAVPGSPASSLLSELKLRSIIENARQMCKAAGLTNDHLVSCFRFQECINGTEVREKDESLKPKTEKKETMDPIDVGIPRAMDIIVPQNKTMSWSISCSLCWAIFVQIVTTTAESYCKSSVLHFGM
ncbi:hypothetical protein GH714_025501 [Hevea brasiliensis]|uniref:Uncharacterized protein n=1 Tax=Hevea brasiliensis TaxID=3981 RepID=A0A6A6LN82_HEVBR|nr:hypothetical protein GH714_025501 [Hevea brasiliensis]